MSLAAHAYCVQWSMYFRKVMMNKMNHEDDSREEATGMKTMKRQHV